MKQFLRFVAVLVLTFVVSVSFISCASNNVVTPLMISSVEGDVEAVKSQISKDEDINAKLA